MIKPIKNHWFFYCIITFCSIIPISGIAGIYFMERPEEPINRDLRHCVQIGYKLTSCSGNKAPAEICPKDNRFFNKCACPEKYQYDNTNCNGSKVLSGGVCEGKYETCSCSQEYSKTCTGTMVGSGEGCDNKYKSCKCSDSYTTCQYGGSANATQCVEENGTVKWSECKVPSCEEGGYLSSVPSHQTCNTKSFANKTCYDTCRALTCTDGGYQSSTPSGQTCTSISYAGKTCHKDCVNSTPSCASGGYISLTESFGVDKLMYSCSPVNYGIECVSCVEKRCHFETTGYYKNIGCLTMKRDRDYYSSITGASSSCSIAYSNKYKECKDSGTTPGQYQGTCDTDSWRRCCEQCVGAGN